MTKKEAAVGEPSSDPSVQAGGGPTTAGPAETRAARNSPPGTTIPETAIGIDDAGYPNRFTHPGEDTVWEYWNGGPYVGEETMGVINIKGDGPPYDGPPYREFVPDPSKQVTLIKNKSSHVTGSKYKEAAVGEPSSEETQAATLSVSEDSPSDSGWDLFPKPEVTSAVAEANSEMEARHKENLKVSAIREAVGTANPFVEE